MNNIRQIQELNKRELEAGISPEASWHADYRDTAYVYIGGLPFELSEGDVVAIFSQFGEPTYVNLVRDKETGKSRGFAFLKYEDQRSTDLAVDNLGGATIMGRTLRVDHTRYKKKDDEPDEGLDLTTENLIEPAEVADNPVEAERPLLKEERELAALIRDHDDDDPMKAFMIEEKREEVSKALALLKNVGKSEKHRSSTHKHHRSHRSREDDEHRHRHRSSRLNEDDKYKEERRGSRRHRTERSASQSLPRERSNDRRYQSYANKRRSRSRSRSKDTRRRD